MIHATQSYFQGHWQMVRIIENVVDGVIGEVWGQADFRHENNGLVCFETGVLRFNGHDYHTGRTALWRFAGERIEVSYEDGRPFHDFLVREPLVLAIDGNAEFRIEYEFDHDTWTSTWEVLDPGHRYMMTTRYRR